MTEICLKSQTIRWPKVGDQEFAYIDLTSVDRQTHAIGETQAINASNAPSRAQQIVKTDDVLFGTTRPTLMRYCSVPQAFDGQICSTGYCVLRPDREQVHPRWIFHLVSSSAFFRYVDENQKGAGYPAIADSAVMHWEVPIPPMDEQERIVGILDKFEALVNDLISGLPAELRARRQQYEHYRDRLLNFKDNPNAHAGSSSQEGNPPWEWSGNPLEERIGPGFPPAEGIANGSRSDSPPSGSPPSGSPPLEGWQAKPDGVVP